MFIGHFALGLAAKRAAPRTSLGVLFAASQLADYIWPVLVLVGLERVRVDPGNTAFTPLDFVSYPYSHSLLWLAVWAIVFAGAFAIRARNTRLFVVLAALVLSHWVLDVATHRPDLPVYPGGPKYGLGLWNSVPATLVLESLLFAGGVVAYLRATRARDRAGRWAFGSLVAVLLLIYISSVFGPPPPSDMAIALVGVLGAVLVTGWAWWADRHRTAGTAT